MSLNKKLIEFRENKGFTQKELAKRLNITQQAYSAYERGHAYPSIDILVNLSMIYNISIDHILLDEILKNEVNYVSTVYLPINSSINKVLQNKEYRKKLELFADYLLYKK